MASGPFDKLIELYESIDPSLNQKTPEHGNPDKESLTDATKVILDKIVHGATEIVGYINHDITHEKGLKPVLHSKLALALKCIEDVKYAFKDETAAVSEDEIPSADTTTPDGENAPVMAFRNVQG